MTKMNFGFPVAPTLAALMLASCESPNMETVPSAETILSSDALQPFLVAGNNITGVYQNFDVDSPIFYYSTSCQNERDLPDAIRGNIKEAGWNEANGATRPRHQFERRFQAGEELPNRSDVSSFRSTEILHLAFVENKRMVVVAYL